jgi:hypothetical protein
MDSFNSKLHLQLQVMTLLCLTEHDSELFCCSSMKYGMMMLFQACKHISIMVKGHNYQFDSYFIYIKIMNDERSLCIKKGKNYAKAQEIKDHKES